MIFLPLLARKLKPKMKKVFMAAMLAALFIACTNKQAELQKEVQTYLDTYNTKYQEFYKAASEGQWRVQTHIVEGDTMNAYQSGLADQAMAKFTGSKENIDKAATYLKNEKDLTQLQVKQLRKILFLAAGNPESVEDVVKDLIKSGTAQTEKMYGYKFQIEGKEV